MSASSICSRRQFLARGLAAGGAAFLGDCNVGREGPSPFERATLHVKPAAPTGTLTPGQHDLASLGVRAQLYVPAEYRADTPAPLAVLMHGAGRTAAEWMQAPLLPMYDSQSALILSPESASGTWDLMTGGFGPDPKAIDAALRVAFAQCNVDASRLALGGFSDGGSYALSLGLANGELFSALIALSPGFFDAPGYRGKPRIFEAHGTQDQVLPIDQTSRVIVPALRAKGYDVTYQEFAGVHGIYVDIAAQALAWLAAGAVTP